MDMKTFDIHHSFQLPSTCHVKNFINLVCVIGCASHLIFLALDYFQFKTVTLYSPYIPFQQSLPYVTLCVKLDSGIIASLEHEVYDPEPIDQSKVIKNCHRRNFSSHQVEPVNCSRGFITSQCIRGKQHQCYTITAINDTKYMILDAAAVVNDRRVLYTFYLTEYFEKYQEIMCMMHFKRRTYEEFRFASSSVLGEGEKNVSIEIGYKLFESYKLPYPYDTDCIDASVCLNAHGRRFAWCNKALCVNNITITYNRIQKAPIRGIFMEVRSIASPTTKVQYVPKKNVNSFILEVCSLLGLWLSFSVHLISGSLFQSISRRKSHEISEKKLASSWHRKILSLSKRAGIDIGLFNRIIISKLSAPSKKETKNIRVFRLIFKILIICVYLREMYIISNDFFKYQTRVNVVLRPNGLKEYPSISLCIDMYEWFHHHEPIFRFRDYDDLRCQFTKDFNYTLKEIFEATPNESIAIDQCQVRHSASSPLVTTTNCQMYLNVTKFYFGQFMCYNFKPLVKFIPVLEIEHDPSVLYSVIVEKHLANVSHYQPIVSYGIPTVSRFLVSEVWKQSKHELVDLDYKISEYSRLPPPYDTKCAYINVSNECEVSCMNFSQISLVPFSQVYTEPIDSPILDYLDLKSNKIADFAEEAESRCRDKCPSPCEDSFVKTIRDIGKSNYSLQLTLTSSKYPVYSLTALPVYTEYEYLYQLACSASFWIGFSLVNFTNIMSTFKCYKKISTSPLTPVYLVSVTDELDRIIRKKFATYQNSHSKRLKKSFKHLKGQLKGFLFFAFVAIGFFVHSSITASVYFEYPSSMDTRFVFESNFTGLRATICISIDQLDLGGNHSLKNIWAKSPSSDEFMVECGYRGVNVSELSHLPANLRRRILPYLNVTSLCYSLIHVHKFTTLGLLCYRPIARANTVDPEYHSQYQIGFPRVYEYYILSKKMSGYNLTVAISQGPQFNALIMPTTPHRTWPDSKCQFYYISYVKFSITSLPFPYHMGSYDSLKRILCIRNCLERRTEKIGVFSPYAIADNASDLIHETRINSVEPKFVGLRKNCEAACMTSKRRQQSYEFYFDAFSEGPYDTVHFLHQPGTIGLWFTTTDQLVTITAFYPKLRLVDLVIFIGSIFSIWFGFSALNLIDWVANKIEGDKRHRDRLAVIQKMQSMDELMNRQSNSHLKRTTTHSESRDSFNRSTVIHLGDQFPLTDR